MSIISLQVIMRLLDMLDQTSEFVGNLTRKLSAPLVTLLSSEPEIQYVALRNIGLIIQKRWVLYEYHLSRA